MNPHFFAHWLTTGSALAVTSWMLSGVRIDSLFSLGLAALVLGLINASVRPLLLLLTLPFTMLTLGLFYFIVNGVAFSLAATLVPGFSVTSFFSAILGAVNVGLVSWFISLFVGEPRRTTRSTVVEVHRHRDGRWGP